jgi:hypothetical protein
LLPVVARADRLPARPRRWTACFPAHASLRPDEYPTPRSLDQRQALRRRRALQRREALAPGGAGRYHGGNCPGCGSAPIEACRKADGVHDYPLTAVRLGRYLTITVIAVVDVGRAQVLLGVQAA